MITYKCTKCGATMESPTSMAGQKDQCPLCRNMCLVPASIKTKGAAVAKSRAKTENHIIVLAIGILATMIAGSFRIIHDPSAYTIGALVASVLVRLVSYSVILGLVALVVAAIRKDVRKYWFPIMAWLFLIAGVFGVVVGGYTVATNPPGDPAVARREEPVEGRTHASKGQSRPRPLTAEELELAPGKSEPAKSEQDTPLSPEQLFERASPAVVYIVVRDGNFKPIGLGSGFFVDANGLIVTNYHVIKGAEFATACLSSGATLFVDGIAATDPDADLALLKVSGGEFPFLKNAAAPLPKVGSTVYAIGNPQGLENTFSGGMVSGHRKIKDGFTAIQVTTPISPGSSGGPLLNASGEVVGVTTAYLTGGQNLNFAVPVADVQRLIERQGKVRTLASAGGGRLGQDESEELDKAWMAISMEDWRGASEILIRLRKSERDNPFVWFALGYLHRKLGNHEIAIQHYKQAITLKPDYAQAYCWMGISYAGLELYTEAVAAYKQAISVKPDYPEAYYFMGVSYDGLEAIAAFKKAIAIKPDYAKAWYGMGIAYQVLKKHPEAVASFKQAIAVKPDYAKAWYGMGNAYSVMSNNYMIQSLKGLEDKHSEVLAASKQALAAYKQVIAFKPDHAGAWYGMGSAYQDLEKHSEAIKAFKKSIALKPDDAAAYYSMGSSYEKLGQRAAALAAYRESLRLKPTDEFGFADLARDGIRRLAKAPAATPVDAKTEEARQRMQMYRMYRSAGLTSKALVILRSIIKDFPNTDEAKSAEGYIKQLEDETKKARKDS